MRFERRQDAGVVQLFEAIVIGLILISAIFFALTFESPSSGPSRARTDLQAISYDGVNSMAHTNHHDARYGNNFMSKAVAEALQGDSTNLTGYLDDFYPPGTVYNVYIGNGWDRQPVHYVREPTGQTAGVSLSFEPHWRYIFARPDLELYGEGSDLTLGTYMVPVYDSNPVHDPGQPIKVEASGDQNFVPADLASLLGETNIPWSVAAHTSSITGPTPEGTDYPVVSIYMECGTDPDPENRAPCYSGDLTAATPPFVSSVWPEREFNMNITIENFGDVALSETVNPTLEVQFPVGFVIDFREDWDPDGDWAIKKFRQGPSSPALIRAELQVDLAAAGGLDAKARLPFDLQWTPQVAPTDPPYDDRYPFKVIHATMENGSASRSTFVLRTTDADLETYSGNDVRIVYPSIPKPMNDGDAALVGVVVVSPIGSTEVDRVEFESLDGADLWTCPTSVEQPSAWAISGPLAPDNDCTGSHFWAHGAPMPATNGLFELQLELAGANNPTEAGIGSPGREDVTPNAVYSNGAETRSVFHRVKRDVFLQYHPPEQDTGTFLFGYPNPTSAADEGTLMPWTAQLPYRAADLRGRADYTVVPLLTDDNLLAARDALSAAELDIAKYNYTLEERVGVTIDVNDLSRFVSNEYGLSTFNATSYIYRPESLDSGETDLVFRHSSNLGLISLSAQRINDLVAFTGDGIGSEDIAAALGSGRVVGVSGDSGTLLAGYDYTLNDVENANANSAATHLARNAGSGTATIVVGASSPETTIQGIGESLTASPGSGTSQWTGDKFGASDTLAVVNDRDVLGDGEPDVFASYTNGQGLNYELPDGSNTNDLSELILYDGATGDYDSGWRLFTPGTSGIIGTMDLGPATPGVGVWATTGLDFGTSSHAVINREPTVDPSIKDPNSLLDAINAAGDATIGFGVYEGGLKGWADAGVEPPAAAPLWNVRGLVFSDVVEGDSDGDGWSELYAGDEQGYVYAFNATKPLAPVDGVNWGNFGGPFVAVDMWGAREGYTVTSTGVFVHTRDNWNTIKPVQLLGLGALQDVTSVDAVDAARIWWGGTNGLIGRADGRLDNFYSPTAFVRSGPAYEVANGETTSLLQLPDQLEMSELDITDVHAVSWTEAWFTAVGNDTLGLADKAFILHTTDGGASLTATEYVCKNRTTGLKISCGLNGIEEREDGSIYAFGDKGLVLVKDPDSMAARTAVDAAVPVESPGYLNFTVDVTDSSVTVDQMKVTWDVGSFDVGWMERVRVVEDVGGAGQELQVWWEPTDLLSPDYAIGTTSKTFGAGGGATLNVTNFRAAEMLDDAALPVGKHAFRLETFRDAAGTTTYDDDTLPPGVAYVELFYSDGSSDIVSFGWGPGKGMLDDQGRAIINITTPNAVDEIKDIDISWDAGGADIAWMEEVAIDDDNDGAGWEHIWNRDHALAVTGSAHATAGAGSGATLHVRCSGVCAPDGWVDYNNTLSGGPLDAADVTDGQAIKLRFGPFHDALDDTTYSKATIDPAYFVINVTYKDTSTGDLRERTYYANWSDAPADILETDGSLWRSVQDAGETMAPCVWGPDPSCPDLLGADFLRDGGTDYGLFVGEGGAVWRQQYPVATLSVWTDLSSGVPVSTDLHGVAFKNATSAFAAGETQTLLATYTSGATWETVPVPQNVEDLGGTKPFYDVADAGNHQVHVVGGVYGSSLQFSFNGYREIGHAYTTDLATSTVRHVAINFTSAAVFESASTKVQIAATTVPHPTLAGKPSPDPADWVVVKPEGPNEGTGPNRIIKNFEDSVKSEASHLWLNFTLRNDDSDRTTPILRGTFVVRMCGAQSIESCKWKSPSDVKSVTFDLNQTTNFDMDWTTVDIGTVQRPDGSGGQENWAGEMHLKPAQVRWVAHPNAVDDTSPVAAMDLAPIDGGAEPGTQLAVAFGEDATGAPTAAGRKSVHVLNTGNGKAWSQWTPRWNWNSPGCTDISYRDCVRGVPTEVLGGNGRVYVAIDAGDIPADSYQIGVHLFVVGQVEPGGSPKAGLTDPPVTAMTLVDHDGDSSLELAYATEATSSQPATIWLLNGDSFVSEWSSIPSIPGQFSFGWDVPRNATFGVYIVETQLNWTIVDDLPINPADTVLQTARLVDTFIVTPPERPLSPSPSYTLEVIAWLEHWG